MYSDLRAPERHFQTEDGMAIQSFCVTVEVKTHRAEDIRFVGNSCYVVYNGREHNVTEQSERQKYSVRSYLIENTASRKAPFITNLIWLRNVPTSQLPSVNSNLIGGDVSWRAFMEAVARLSGASSPTPHRSRVVRGFSSNRRFDEALGVFSQKLASTPLDRKKIEYITRRVLDRGQQYGEKLGEQLLIFRGRGGTGKTVRLLRLAHQAYDERGLRVLILTYNKALAADLNRVLSLMEIRSSVADESVSIKTVHSFMREWFVALGIHDPSSGKDFLAAYDSYKSEALALLRGEALGEADLIAAQRERSGDLTWDLILIDEAQDWPEDERDLLYWLYGHKRLVLADGVDQMIRQTRPIDWRQGLPNAETQVVALTKSLRLKASLADTVGHLAEQLDVAEWKIEPNHEAYGGNVEVLIGDVLTDSLADTFRAIGSRDGTRPIDTLSCVPPSWVRDVGGQRESRLGQLLRRNGLKTWDAVEKTLRDEFPRDVDRFRIVQYDSCRGLEGWTVCCFGLDEFFDHKRSHAAISDQERFTLMFNEDDAALQFAKRWLMIPFTRAIDTLVLHVTAEDSYVGQLLLDLHGSFPDQVALRRVTSSPAVAQSS